MLAGAVLLASICGAVSRIYVYRLLSILRLSRTLSAWWSLLSHVWGVLARQAFCRDSWELTSLGSCQRLVLMLKRPLQRTFGRTFFVLPPSLHCADWSMQSCRLICLFDQCNTYDQRDHESLTRTCRINGHVKESTTMGQEEATDRWSLDESYRCSLRCMVSNYSHLLALRPQDYGISYIP